MKNAGCVAGFFLRVPGFFVVHLSFFVVSGRDVLHTPHKRPDRGESKTVGRAKFLPFGAYNIDRGGVAPSPLHPFLVLILGKGCEKKIKASGMPAKLAGYRAFLLFVFRFLLSRVGRKSIRPTNDPKGVILSIYRSPHLSLRDKCGAYSFAPLPYQQEVSPIYIHNVYHVPRPSRF